jgi:Xaa-Pro aminopeptidase
MKIPDGEFKQRIDSIQTLIEKNGLDGLAVYGDEYRKENLRYVSNFWPIFERGMLFIPKTGGPILAGAPEGAEYAKEMNVWRDVRNVKEFACVSVPDEIDYPLAEFSSFSEIVKETLSGGKKLGLVGYFDIPAPIYRRLFESYEGMEIINSDEILYKMRLIKSDNEIACLKECGRIACAGYKAILDHAIPGNSERKAAAAGEGAAMNAGAEAINFHVFASGERTHTIIGRPVEKIIEEGEMIMSALAVQYEGYVTTVEFPFVAGKPSDEQKRLLETLFEAGNVQQNYLKAGVITGEMVKAVKAVYKKHNMEEYDVYPPMHGIGLAEAESPYPDENSVYPFESGMCVNSDISLFGHSAGSNRIEEGFVIREDRCESLTPTIRELIEKKKM